MRQIHKYGQHFLVSQRAIADIVDAAEVLRAENLVEIGPGQGALTQALIDRGRTNFTVIEIDPEMVAYLQNHLPSASHLAIHQANFLDFDLNTLPPVPTQFVSNLPYIDAAAILDKVLAWKYFKTAVFMFQKEQAQKITARPSDKAYGALSVLSQLRARIHAITDVGRGGFQPPPKVDSRVLAFEKLEFPATWAAVEKVVQTAFLHRRKTLLNALQLGGYKKDQIVYALGQLGLSDSVRPEQISAGVYALLTRYLQ